MPTLGGSFLDHASRWTKLSGLGKLRVFRWSYFFLVFVPIAARVIVKLDPDVDIALFGEVFHFSLGLPFSWKIFYFSSVSFVIATTLYYVFCPTIVKELRDFREFREQGRAQAMVKQAFLDYVDRRQRAGRWSLYADFIRRFTEVGDVLRAVNEFVESRDAADAPLGAALEIVVPVVPEAIPLEKHRDIPNMQRRAAVEASTELRADFLKTVDISGAKLQEAFWYARGLVDEFGLTARVTCLCAYVVGFLLFGVVAVQNFWYVLKVTLG